MERPLCQNCKDHPGKLHFLDTGWICSWCLDYAYDVPPPPREVSLVSVEEVQCADDDLCGDAHFFRYNVGRGAKVRVRVKMWKDC